MAISAWKVTTDPVLLRRIGKTLEELAELSAVLARIQIQGIDEIDPSSGKTNRERLHEETADVWAQICCNVQSFKMDVPMMIKRANTKQDQMNEWESLL